MPQRLVFRLGVALAGAALVVTPLAACTDEGPAAPDGGSIAGMLSLVPDTEANRTFVLISLYEKAEKAAELKPQGGTAKERELRRIVRLSNDQKVGTGVANGDLGTGSRVREQYGALGYVPSDVTAEVTANLPPSQVTIATGEFDADKVLDKAAETKGSTRKEVDGTEVVRWLDDLAVDPKLETPVGQLSGQAGRIALPADGVLTYAKSDAISKSVNATVKGDRTSLADNDDLATVAERLDDLDVHSAYLSTEPVSAPKGQSQTGDPGSALARYDAIGVGAALKDKKPRLVVVLVHGSDRAAEQNAKGLKAKVADGKSAATGRPWSDQLSDPDIEQDGRVVVASFRVKNPTLWYRLVLQGDNLLAVS